MAENGQLKYKEKITSSGFSKALAERVDAYFEERRISRHANLEMISKTVLGFTLWIGTYLLILSDRFSSLGLAGMYVLHGFAQVFIAFNIAHDANHGAYSKSKRVNRALGCVFDLVGGSSYMWRLFHNDSHHAFVNVRKADTALESGNVFRFSPRDRRRPFHRYQHIYAPFLYCLSTLDWVLTKDYRWLFHTGGFGNRKIVRSREPQPARDSSHVSPGLPRPLSGLDPDRPGDRGRVWSFLPGEEDAHRCLPGPSPVAQGPRPRISRAVAPG